jgi:hypothetical protein
MLIHHFRKRGASLAEAEFPLRKLVGIPRRMCKARDLFSGEIKASKLRRDIGDWHIKDKRATDRAV